MKQRERIFRYKLRKINDFSLNTLEKCSCYVMPSHIRAVIYNTTMRNETGNVLVGVLVVIILLVIGGGYLASTTDLGIFQRGSATNSPSPTSSSTYSIESSEDESESSINDSTDDTQLYMDDFAGDSSSPSETSMLNDNSVNLDVTTNLITLTNVGADPASGTATRAVVNNQLTHTVEAELPPLTGSYEYEGWLVNRVEGVFISTGVMEQETDTDFSLVFTADQPYTGYDQVVITLESVAGDSIPEDHVLEGDF